MELSVYFDNVLVEQPDGWRELSTSITFDYAANIYNIDYTQQLTFYGSAYENLYARYLSGNTCNIVDVRIELVNAKGCQHVIHGNIFVTACTFNERRCSVRVKIEDNAFSSWIQNNRETPVLLSGDTSKNGVTITPPPLVPINLFKPSNGVFQYRINGFKVFDVMRYLIEWMSDGRVAFQSSLLDTGAGEGDYITSAANLIAAVVQSNTDPAVGEIYPRVSFTTMYDWVRKNRVAAMGFETINGQPTVVIEHIDYFRASGAGVTFQDVGEWEMSFVQELLYANVRVGGDVMRRTECDRGNTSCVAANRTDFIGFKSEAYAIQGQCNTDAFLDLTHPQGIECDPNLIEDLLIYKTDKADPDTCIALHVNPFPPVYFAAETDPFGIGQYWYNEAYSNRSVLLRYADYLAGDIDQFSLVSNVDMFYAELGVSGWRDGTPPHGLNPPNPQPPQGSVPSLALESAAIPHVVNVVDPDSAYDIPTNAEMVTDRDRPRWTPQFSGGAQFRCRQNWENNVGDSVGVIQYLWLVISRFDSGNNLVEQVFSPRFERVTSATSPTMVNADWTTPFVFFEQGDYLTLNARIAQLLDPSAFPTGVILRQSFPLITMFSDWQTVQVLQSRPTGQINGGGKRYGVRRRFTYPMPLGEQLQLLSDLNNLHTFTSGLVSKQGFIESVRFDHVQGHVEVALISD